MRSEPGVPGSRYFVSYLMCLHALLSTFSQSAVTRTAGLGLSDGAKEMDGPSDEAKEVDGLLDGAKATDKAEEMEAMGGFTDCIEEQLLLSGHGQ